MKIIDCRGLSCPQPVITTKKYFDLKDSKEVVVIVDNEVAKENILRLAKDIKLENQVSYKDGIYKVSLSKSSLLIEFIEDKIEEVDNKANNLTILVASNLFGNGDPDLGEVLMKAYIYSLSESVILPENIIFINSGAKLTCQGSKVIDSLISMKEKGVNIISCGACLDFYGLNEKLLIGDVGNMYLIVQLMNESKNTIKI